MQSNVLRNASTIVNTFGAGQQSRYAHIWFRFGVTQYDNLTAIEILGVAQPHSLFPTRTYTHTRSHTTATAIHCALESIEWALLVLLLPLLLLYRPVGSSFFVFRLFPFLAFVCRPSVLLVWCHPYYFVCCVRTLYIDQIQLARDSGGDGGHASHRVHFDNALGWQPCALAVCRVLVPSS